MSKKKEMGKQEEAKVLKPNFKEREVTPFIPEGHKMPKTRREFIAHGFISGMAAAALPTFTTILATQDKAFAQSTGCELPAFQGGLPYVCIDLGGGANFAGQNVIVGFEPNGQVQEDFTPTGWAPSDFIRLGLPPEEHPNNPNKIDDRYGLKFHRSSGILQGMREILDGQTMPNGELIEKGVDGCLFACRTADDTATNPINTTFMANKAGAQGQLVQIIGNNATDSGARSLVPPDQYDSNLRSTVISSGNDAAGLLSLGSTLSGNQYLNASEIVNGNNVGQERIKKFMDRISNMSKTKLAEINQKSPLGQLQQVLNCSFENAKQLFDAYSADQLNPANDAAIVTAFANAPQKDAAVAKLVLSKIAGAGTITMGGYDYHGNGAQVTHDRDVEVGRTIGRLILAARLKEENLCLHVYTDGAVGGDAGGTTQGVTTINGVIPKVMWTNDSGTRSSALMIVYKHDHDGSSLVREDSNNVPRRQVGSFVKAGGVNLNTPIGNSTQALWQAIMLNYLALQGREGEYDSIFGLASVTEEFRNWAIRFKPL